jgi:hypothetical protein
MALVRKKKKNREERIWQERALALYPGSRIRETSFEANRKMSNT